MQITEHQTRVPLRLVISAGQRPAVERKRQSRPAHVRLVVDEKPRRKLLAAMSYAAATRRQAARRLRRKLQVERATSMLLISFLVATAAAQLLFGGSNASAAQRPVWALTLVTTISALLTVWRATVEQTVYAICEFDSCLHAIELLSQELRQAPAADVALVRTVRRRYGDILQQCNVRHSLADHLAVKLAAGRPSAHWRWRAAYFADVYLIHAIAVAMPLATVLIMAI